MSLYNPPHFRIADRDALRQAIAAQPFATLISNGPGEPLISHLPLFLVAAENDSESDRLIGHLARANPHWREAAPSHDSVAVFHGPDAYVSPGWYPSKQAHGRVVPTWNYSVIHAVGRLVTHDDADWLRRAVTRLTEQHESGRSGPWAVNDAPDTFIAGQLKGIVGVELVVSHYEGKFKLSQNRSEDDRQGVINGLDGESGQGSAAIRAMMTRGARPD